MGEETQEKKMRKLKDKFKTKTLDANVGKTHDVFGHRFDDVRFYDFGKKNRRR